MEKYVIISNTFPHLYVTKEGEKRYTTDLQKARLFDKRGEAISEMLPKKERLATAKLMYVLV